MYIDSITWPVDNTGFSPQDAQRICTAGTRVSQNVLLGWRLRRIWAGEVYPQNVAPPSIDTDLRKALILFFLLISLPMVLVGN